MTVIIDEDGNVAEGSAAPRLVMRPASEPDRIEWRSFECRECGQVFVAMAEEKTEHHCSALF